MTVTATKKFDFTITTLGSLMDDPIAGPALAQLMPELDRLPMLDVVRNMPVKVVFYMAADAVGPEGAAALKARLNSL